MSTEDQQAALGSQPATQPAAQPAARQRGAAQVAGRLITTLDDLPLIDFAKQDGLVPQVAQDARTGEVLMLGYANAEAAQRTVATGQLWFWSRQRGRLWRKGETSGNTHELVSLHADCDADALLALVIPAGPTCHTGTWSCFEAPPTLAALGRVIEGRVIEARATSGETTGSYTAKLLQDENLRLKKLGEEAVELALACTASDTERAAEEAADLIYHALVACAAVGVDVPRVLDELRSRSAATGHTRS